MNATLSNAGKQILKGLLSQCTEPQQNMFKRMYAGKNNAGMNINDCVDLMDDDRIDHAIAQCERTVEKNQQKATS